MNAAILIAGRELRDRSRLFLIATVLAAIPFIAALTVEDHRKTGMAMTASLLAIGYAAVVALTLGISAIGRELSEKRASFLFSKPVSPAAMWFGKTAAAVMICLGAFAIIALPTYMLARDGWRDLWGRSNVGVLFAIILCVALFFGGHVASTMLRSRSSRVLLDVAFLVMAVVAFFAILRPLVAAGGGAIAMKVSIAIGIALLVVLIAAPVWQLARGRIDPLRHHLALSTVLWSAVAVLLIAAAAYVSWVISPPLSSVTGLVGLDQSPSGEWAFVSGIAPDRGMFMASYLIDTKTGHRERLTLPLMTGVQFSADGKVAAWFENDTLFPRFASPGLDAREMLQAAEATYGTGRFRLYTRRLEPGAKHVATPLTAPLPRMVQLSDDGSRVALASKKGVEVYEVATGRFVAATPSADQSVRAMLFVTPDRLRIIGSTYVVTPRQVISTDYMRELDLAANRLATVSGWNAHPTVMLRDGSVIETPDAVIGEVGDSRLLLRTRSGLLRIADRATGKVEVEVSGVGGPTIGWVRTIAPQYDEGATFVGIDRQRRYVLWEARTGTVRPLPM
jgi:ABC-type transport system involved in multi-copper enzyme maturation permease subunit